MSNNQQETPPASGSSALEDKKCLRESNRRTYKEPSARGTIRVRPFARLRRSARIMAMNANAIKENDPNAIGTTSQDVCKKEKDESVVSTTMIMLELFPVSFWFNSENSRMENFGLFKSFAPYQENTDRRQ
ncbi:unnamed protein product, partial [Iphiclides podalirius]